MLKYAFPISSSIACLSIAYAAFIGASSVQRVAFSASALELDAHEAIALADSQTSFLRKDLRSEVTLLGS